MEQKCVAIFLMSLELAVSTYARKRLISDKILIGYVKQ